MRKSVFFIAMLLVCTGCRSETQSLMRSLDSLIFKTSGVSLLSNPSSVSIKELRLSGNKLETELVIEGQVEEMSKNGTFFVISDHSARLLVVTTDLSRRISDTVFKGSQGAAVRVIGKVEIGKKGLPFLRATAITSSGVSIAGGSKS
jgi:hypothetical protein